MLRSHFAEAFIVLLFVEAYIYYKFLATFSMVGVRAVFFLAIVLICGGFGIAFSLRCHRNILSLLIGVTFPILLYDSLIMCQFISQIRKFIIMGIVVAFVVVTIEVWNVTNRKRFIRKLVVVSRTACCIVLLVSSLYGNILIHNERTLALREGEYSQSEDKDGIIDYENTLAANIEILAKLDQKGGWEDLTLEEKLDVLEAVLKVECRYLGMLDSMPKLEVAHLADGLQGKYIHEEDRIVLSYSYMVETNANGYSVVQVLCHEMYHRYQQYQVDLLKEIRNNGKTEKYANLLLFYNTGIYEKEMDNYVSPSESYNLYAAQETEMDADEYAASAKRIYYEQIQSYF